MNRKIAELKPYAKNARVHSPKQLEQIKNSIREFGFTAPVLIDENDLILAGHGRIEAAKLAGMVEVPVRVIEGLSEKQKRAYTLADNKIALNAEWNYGLLQSELAELTDFDFLELGFSKIDIEPWEPGAEFFGSVDQTPLKENAGVQESASFVVFLKVTREEKASVIQELKGINVTVS